MESKIKIQIGNVHVDYEGSEEYIKNELPILLENLLSFNVQDPVEEERAESLPTDMENPIKKKIDMTTNTIASKLDAKSGGDLVIAACAHLALVKGADSFSRANILAEMQTASNFYKKTYSNNFSTYLGVHVKSGKLLETAKDVYALDSKTLKELEKSLNA